MEPENIAAIVIAGISALASIATVTYVKLHSAFGDKQDTSVKIINTTTKATNEKPNAITNSTEIVINLGNFESYATKSVQSQNGKQEANKTTTIKKSLATEITPLVKEDKLPDQPGTASKDSLPLKLLNEEVIDEEDLEAVLQNNTLGDKQIGETRQYLTNHALNIYKQIIELNTELFVSAKTTEENVIDVIGHDNTDNV